MIETRSQKASKDDRARLNVEIYPNPPLDENWMVHGREGNRNRRLTSESTPVEQGHDFANSTGTLDRKDILELSDISTENPAVGGSSIDNTMMHGVTEKTATSCLGKLFPFDLGSGAGDEVDTQEEKEDNGEIDKFESHVSLNSSTHENKASPNRETGYSDLRLLMEYTSQESS